MPDRREHESSADCSFQHDPWFVFLLHNNICTSLGSCDLSLTPDIPKRLEVAALGRAVHVSSPGNYDARAYRRISPLLRVIYEIKCLTFCILFVLTFTEFTDAATFLSCKCQTSMQLKMSSTFRIFSLGRKRAKRHNHKIIKPSLTSCYLLQALQKDIKTFFANIKHFEVSVKSAHKSGEI